MPGCKVKNEISNYRLRKRKLEREREREREKNRVIGERG
jgi:hypothetical protein